MMLSFNLIIFAILGLYASWMAMNEDRKEKASAKTLTPELLKTFNDSYRMSQPVSSYPAELQAHAAIAHPARIRKLVAVIVVTVLISWIILVGF